MQPVRFHPLLSVAICLGLVAGCKKETEKPVAPAAATPAEATTATPPMATAELPDPAPTPAETLGVEVLVAAFKADAAAARKKYEHATIEIEGLIASVTRDTSNRPELIVVSASEVNPLVYCYTADPQPWKTLGNAQRVSVKGIVTVDSFDKPRLMKATVRMHGPPTLIISTPEAMLAGGAPPPRDIPPSLRGKYTGPSYLITGKVVSKVITGGTIAGLRIGREGDSVLCEFTGYSKSLATMFAAIEVGQMVTVAGTGDVAASKLNKCSLVDAR
jgi:hypothetical protein